MSPALLSVARGVLPRRGLHKGVDSTPPLRFTPVPERIALYSMICLAFISYPTYVVCNLDKMRTLPSNRLSEEVQAKIDAVRAARK